MFKKSKASILTQLRMTAVQLLQQALEVQYGKRVWFLELNVNSNHDRGNKELVHVEVSGRIRFCSSLSPYDHSRFCELEVLATIKLVKRGTPGRWVPHEFAHNFFVSGEMYTARFEGEDVLYQVRVIPMGETTWNVGYSSLERWTEPLYAA